MTQESSPTFDGVLSPEFAPGRLLSKRYRIDRVLGGGGMGVILAGWHMELGQRVAIKALRPEALSDAETVTRFMREARALARIQSEHVARVIDVGKEGPHPFIVMEYLRGSDLSALQKKVTRFSIDEAVAYVLQASEAIAEAHQVGIVHRDIKPANLFLTKRADGSPLVKVLDFGISKVIEPTSPLPGEDPLTKTSMMMGSPHYMPPEQLKNARDADTRADIWALGVVLYRLITGEHAFNAETSAELCVAILVGEHVPLRNHLPNVPEGLVAVIDKCLQKDRLARFQRIAELASALAPFAPASAKISIDRIANIGTSQRESSIPPPAPFPEHAAVTIPEGATTSVDVLVEPGTKVTSLTSTESLQKSAGIPRRRTGWMIVAAGIFLALSAIGVVLAPRIMAARAPHTQGAALISAPRSPDVVPPLPDLAQTTDDRAALHARAPSDTASAVASQTAPEKKPTLATNVGAKRPGAKTSAAPDNSVQNAPIQTTATPPAPTPTPTAAPTDATGFGERK